MRVALLVAVTLAIPAVLALPAPAPVPEVLAGFSVAPLAAVAVPTALAFGPDGDLYATTLAGTVERIHLAWTGAGPVAVGASTFASGFSQPLGLWWVGDVLLVSDSHAGAESGRTDGRVSAVVDGERVVVIDGLPAGRHHANHMREGPDGRVYLANGNPNDAGPNGGPPDVFPYSGAILSFRVDEVLASPAILRWVDASGAPIPPGSIAAHPRNADFAQKVHVLAWGFRNVFGIAFGADGTPYTAMNGADVPSSQDALYRIAPGTFYGFPFCFSEGVPGSTAVSVVNNPLYPSYDCSAVPPADALLGWHVCATGLDVAPASWPEGFAGSVFIGECGPFFPEPHAVGVSTHDAGHKVARVPIGPDGSVGEVHDFLVGLALPTDVLFGPDDAMYVADAEGVLRVAPLR